MAYYIRHITFVTYIVAKNNEIPYFHSTFRGFSPRLISWKVKICKKITPLAPHSALALDIIEKKLVSSQSTLAEAILIRERGITEFQSQLSPPFYTMFTMPLAAPFDPFFCPRPLPR